MRQAEKQARLVEDVLEVDQAATLANDIEQIAMFPGGGIGPFAGGSLRRLLEPHEH
ncbi:UNVERIFIED_ORG: hypothetical protein J2R93_000470 [Bradyrhizobium japonicum]|nr:hypothetical protein [Bradyrhizobium japonicum]MBP2430119.1 hypothetical protein [Bradyrhizobium elkanii]MCP1754461.1 hypothetical protein [Bradyrhizobium elkanii]MCP1973653.1 hypothetical protein [Bradyrhizobium elkanii]MCS3474716.1 hypothetical protein [Bradyrhizobium elkanii]